MEPCGPDEIRAVLQRELLLAEKREQLARHEKAMPTLGGPDQVAKASTLMGTEVQRGG